MSRILSYTTKASTQLPPQPISNTTTTTRTTVVGRTNNDNDDSTTNCNTSMMEGGVPSIVVVVRGGDSGCIGEGWYTVKKKGRDDSTIERDKIVAKRQRHERLVRFYTRMDGSNNRRRSSRRRCSSTSKKDHEEFIIVRPKTTKQGKNHGTDSDYDDDDDDEMERLHSVLRMNAKKRRIKEERIEQRRAELMKEIRKDASSLLRRQAVEEEKDDNIVTEEKDDRIIATLDRRLSNRVVISSNTVTPDRLLDNSNPSLTTTAAAPTVNAYDTTQQQQLQQRQQQQRASRKRKRPKGNIFVNDQESDSTTLFTFPNIPEGFSSRRNDQENVTHCSPKVTNGRDILLCCCNDKEPTNGKYKTTDDTIQSVIPTGRRRRRRHVEKNTIQIRQPKLFHFDERAHSDEENTTSSSSSSPSSDWQQHRTSTCTISNRHEYEQRSPRKVLMFTDSIHETNNSKSSTVGDRMIDEERQLQQRLSDDDPTRSSVRRMRRNHQRNQMGGDRRFSNAKQMKKACNNVEDVVVGESCGEGAVGGKANDSVGIETIIPDKSEEKSCTQLAPSIQYAFSTSEGYRNDVLTETSIASVPTIRTEVNVKRGNAAVETEHQDTTHSLKIQNQESAQADSSSVCGSDDGSHHGEPTISARTRGGHFERSDRQHGLPDFSPRHWRSLSLENNDVVIRTQNSRSGTDPDRGRGVPWFKYPNKSVSHRKATGKVTDNTSMMLMQQSSNASSCTSCLTKSSGVDEPTTGLRPQKGVRTDVADAGSEKKLSQRHERFHNHHPSCHSTPQEEQKATSQISILSLPLPECSSGGNGENFTNTTCMDVTTNRDSPIQRATMIANSDSPTKDSRRTAPRRTLDPLFDLEFWKTTPLLNDAEMIGKEKLRGAADEPSFRTVIAGLIVAKNVAATNQSRTDQKKKSGFLWLPSLLDRA